MNEKINIILAVINSLVFIVMLIALLLQRVSIKQNQKSINNSQKELKATFLGLKIQVNSILISHKLKELDLIDKNSSIEAQQKYNSIKQDIETIKDELDSLTKKIKED